MSRVPQFPDHLLESSPQRFLSLFLQVFKENSESRYGGVIGAILVGSCTESDSRPKDLDIILVLDEESNSRTWNYVEIIQDSFNQQLSQTTQRLEMGRLDVLGVISIDGLTGELVTFVPEQLEAIRNAPGTPCVYVLNQEMQAPLDHLVNTVRTHT